MKRLIGLLTVIVLCSGLLVGCMGGGGEIPDYNQNIDTVLPDDIDQEHFVVEEGKDYYVSDELGLWLSVMGEFFEMKYFTLEGSVRVYPHVYLYERDYFYMLTGDLRDIYAALTDSSTEYAETERDQGYDIQVNVLVDGIYDIRFDVETLKFELVYLSEIETPVYYTMKNCSIYSVYESDWMEMSVNPDNTDEFYIEDFYVEAGKTVSFYNRVHVSNYVVTVDPSILGKYADSHRTMVFVYIGGRYDIYVNARTYVVRMVPADLSEMDYTLGYWEDDDVVLMDPVDESTPYPYTMRITAEKLDPLPIYANEHYKMYELTVVESEHMIGERFYEAGTYDVTVDLRDFTVTVEKLPE